MRITRFRLAVLAPLLFALAGCAPGKTDVTGKVTHRGKTVAWGTVILQGPDGIPMTGMIQPDGTYTVQGVTSGTVLIGVISRDPGVLAGGKGRRPVDKGEGNGQPVKPPIIERSKWFPLPEKYEDPTKSGLSTTLKSGASSYDIDLP